jgi:hypothetical protein
MIGLTIQARFHAIQLKYADVMGMVTGEDETALPTEDVMNVLDCIEHVGPVREHHWDRVADLYNEHRPEEEHLSVLFIEDLFSSLVNNSKPTGMHSQPLTSRGPRLPTRDSPSEAIQVSRVGPKG